MPATRSANCGLSIQTVDRPGDVHLAVGARIAQVQDDVAALHPVPRLARRERGAAWRRRARRAPCSCDDLLERPALRRKVPHEEVDERSARSRIWRAGLNRRSKPIVEPDFADIARAPHAEPAP